MGLPNLARIGDTRTATSGHIGDRPHNRPIPRGVANLQLMLLLLGPLLLPAKIPGVSAEINK